MKIQRLFLLALVCGMGLVSCVQEEETPENKYTIIWQNYNGDILETDRNVKEGVVPTYDGATPTRPSADGNNYVFEKWTPDVVAASKNTTYTASYALTVDTFTIIWQNYNGDVLETDTNVPYGTFPSYDGAIPTRPNSPEASFSFNGWTPSLEMVNQDQTYKATYIEAPAADPIPGVEPVYSSNKEIVEYGFYPQSRVKDETLISELELSQNSWNDWVSYDDDLYLKAKANVYNNETYNFNDGDTIVNEQDYWFKCETIKWKVIKESSGIYYLLSTLLLDGANFYQDYDTRTIDGKTIYSNSYEHSDLRAWLNNDFYNNAFHRNNLYIQEMILDNGASTTDSDTNPYASGTSKDKVYLPTYQDYLNPQSGFDSNPENTSNSRVCKTTDYSRARGVWYNTRDTGLKFNGSYWTRSPSSEFDYCALNVNSGGYLSSYAVNESSHSVRPSICVGVIYEL